jgi:DNA-directed RNA polymerase subunit RPC12/RpoP
MRGSIHLPQRLELTCDKCGERFWITLRSIDGRAIIRCPFCTAKLEPYYAVTPDVRRVLYLATREKLEELIMLELGNEVGLT